jgi:hypothetical protein
MKMSYRKGKVSYNKDRIYPTENTSLKQKRRSFKQWLRDYLKEDDHIVAAEPITVGSNGFNKSFEGWNIRLHRANGGHIVEAWKSEDGPVHTSSYRPAHELFMVTDSEDMGVRINDILVQLMLRG